MHLRRLSRAAFSTPDTPLQRFESDRDDLSLEPQVQNPLNLVLTLRNRAQLPALAEIIKAVQDKIDAAMSGLHDVHFARFLPTPDYSALQVITAYDGDLEPYILDFVKVIGDEFNAILAFVDNAPPLPVQRYPREFMAFVKANNVQGKVFTSYPHATVLDILDGQNTVR